ncbi:MAG: hypothetical protein ACRD88_20455, partial [Terriglobia bacterium]
TRLSPPQLIRGLIQAAAFRSNTIWIGFQHSGSKPIVATIYGAGFVTVKMCAVAGKSKEIPHSILCRAKQSLGVPLR